MFTKVSFEGFNKDGTKTKLEKGAEQSEADNSQLRRAAAVWWDGDVAAELECRKGIQHAIWTWWNGILPLDGVILM